MTRSRKSYRWLGDPRRATANLETDRERIELSWRNIRGRLQMAYMRTNDALDALYREYGVQ